MGAILSSFSHHVMQNTWKIFHDQKKDVVATLSSEFEEMVNRRKID